MSSSFFVLKWPLATCQQSKARKQNKITSFACPQIRTLTLPCMNKEWLPWKCQTILRLTKVKQGKHCYTGCTSIQLQCFHNKSGTQFTQAQSYVNVVMIMVLHKNFGGKKDAWSALHTPQCKCTVGTPNNLYDSTPVLCYEPRSCRQLWACHQTRYTRWMAHVFSSGHKGCGPSAEA